MRNNIFICVLTLILLIGNTSKAQTNVSKGKLSESSMLVEYVLYFLEDDKIEVDDIVKKLAKEYPQFKIIDAMPEPEDVKGSQIGVYKIDDVTKDFTPPDLEYLKYLSFGMNEEQKIALQTSKFAIILDFVFEEDVMYQTLTMANNLVLELSKDKEVIIWDSDTRECFTRTYWEANRKIVNNSINISKHITIHLYQKNEYCRAITLGMLKFGLPDICIENVSCHSNLSTSSLINLTAQTMLEQKYLNKDGEMDIDINTLQNKELKTELLNSLLEGAEKKSKIHLIQGTWEEGDPNNRIIELAFSKQNPQIEHDQLIAKVFGQEDEITMLSHDQEILEASNRAKAKAPQLRKMFNKGLEVGASLLLKFPFANEAGEQEWMWVEVVSWKKDTIKGLLQNTPYLVTRLQSGQEVSKKISEMFDYILYHPDGTMDGNETGKIILKNKQ